MRLPATSYGYVPPPGARAKGWECMRSGCGISDTPAPRGWPHPCRECGLPTDPTFEQPWAHDAEGFKLRRQLTDPEPYVRGYSELALRAWEYKDAWFRGDPAAARTAWAKFLAVKRQRITDDSWSPEDAFEIIMTAAKFDDISPAAAEILEDYPLIDTRNVEDDNMTRTTARMYVAMCIEVLQRESSIGNPYEAALEASMYDVHRRAAGVMMPVHERGLKEAREIRALQQARAAIVLTRRSTDAFRADLPLFASRPESSPVLARADAALDAAQIHDDTGPLDALLREIERAATLPCLAHALRARRLVVLGDLPGALAELDLALRTRDALAHELSPQIHAAQGLIRYQIDPRDLDGAIAVCRAGRQSGQRRLQRATAADSALARLLLHRALRSDTPGTSELADAEEAVRLARGRRRSREPHAAQDVLLLQETLAAHERLSGSGSTARRHREWARLVDGAWTATTRAAMAAAWAGWAVGTGEADLAAEAYQRLVALVAEDSAARYTPQAKERVLAAAQEHAEDAGYWLARGGRYREAVLALETGRAVGLTEVFGRDGDAVIEQLSAIGRTDLAEAYRRAVGEYEALVTRSSPLLREAWERLRAVARQIAAATGSDPLTPEVGYPDITAETGDGALVYIAAAKAGGYALVVAARHDPQFVDIPKLSRAAVTALAGAVLPTTAAATATRSPGIAVRDAETAAASSTGQLRDAWMTGRSADPVAQSLRSLWTDGIRDLVWHSARGRIVTLIPVGLLSLLPLHAAGETATPEDPYSAGRHAGHFSAIRYAPNVRGLRRCRETAGELAEHPDSLLAIDAPDGFGLDAAKRLRYVGRETDEVTRRWAGPGTHPVHGCTWEEFLAAADSHSVWHLACHGSADPGSIMDSRLYFADRDVTLEELRRKLRPGRRRLAVLSACDTNRTDTSVPNEVVGLPSALIQLGFAGVIAAAWRVDDLATAYLMTAFYQGWRQQGEEPAVALNEAQAWMRTATRADLQALMPDAEPRPGTDTYPYADPQYWAAFAYTGA